MRASKLCFLTSLPSLLSFKDHFPMKNTTKVVKLPSISLSNVLLLVEQTSKKRKVLEGMLKALQEKEDKLLLIKDKLLVREHNKVTNLVTEKEMEKSSFKFPLLPLAHAVEFEKVYEMNVFQQSKLRVKGQAYFVKFLDVGDNKHIQAVFAKDLSHGKITEKRQVLAMKWDSDTFERKLNEASEWHASFSSSRTEGKKSGGGKKGLSEILDLAGF